MATIKQLRGMSYIVFADLTLAKANIAINNHLLCIIGVIWFSGLE